MKEQIEIVKRRVQESIACQVALLNSETVLEQIVLAAQSVTECIKTGGTLFTCGNGGSAADAIHIAGELVGRFQKERRAYSAISLNTDIAIITSISNDYGYEYVFSRQVEALMKPKDVLLGISTSGNSVNIIRAFEKSKIIGGVNVLLSGNDGGKLKNLADYSIIVSDQTTARIQECHVCLYHVMCELIEKDLLEI